MTQHLEVNSCDPCAGLREDLATDESVNPLNVRIHQELLLLGCPRLPKLQRAAIWLIQPCKNAAHGLQQAYDVISIRVRPSMKVAVSCLVS